MFYPNAIEEVCFQQNHIDKVFDIIRKNIPGYFQKYSETDGGNSVQDETVAKLAGTFGSSAKPKPKKKEPKKALEKLLKEAIKDFEADRQVYIDKFHPDSLVEYKADVGSFKNTILKNQIPIIRKTLQNKAAKELDKYRIAFATAQPGELFTVTNNIITLARKWRDKKYDARKIETIKKYIDLGYDKLDDEGYTAFGVIGGGIKSHFIYKLFPEMFSNRNREAGWALWYLSEGKPFGCKQDSEFLMINAKEGTTQQNYFYPYKLFSYYALQIYYELKQLYGVLGISIPIEHRFVAVHSFLSFVARCHQDEINVLKQKSQNLQYDY